MVQVGLPQLSQISEAIAPDPEQIRQGSGGQQWKGKERKKNLQPQQKQKSAFAFDQIHSGTNRAHFICFPVFHFNAKFILKGKDDVHQTGRVHLQIF